ncbi:Hypothetical protein A7982_07310 [Minicystis rosea]|nr:Hypothetical protein A7982_07310 [Minicystis rosea]
MNLGELGPALPARAWGRLRPHREPDGPLAAPSSRHCARALRR